ncbi:hypothetical protein FisN_16Hu263 [Fistulifera solaris]|jgi:hypothetical protein|uniref:Uncharacterized protein n=1 Tax=Fistulifera solaris TaxID=1519565 RepID=A0A1Z5KSL5_FISSO|nr:hypothetical protein FisN_16Hu263 [Fistulifera solaris]|eukprot:GAX29303.1 hypothetical protein FisN_16Hu263 [Fistulifera solaris]
MVVDPYRVLLVFLSTKRIFLHVIESVVILVGGRGSSNDLPFFQRLQPSLSHGRGRRNNSMAENPALLVQLSNGSGKTSQTTCFAEYTVKTKNILSLNIFKKKCCPYFAATAFQSRGNIL